MFWETMRRLAGDGAHAPVTLQDVNRANAVPASDYSHLTGGNASSAAAGGHQNGASDANGASHNGVSGHHWMSGRPKTSMQCCCASVHAVSVCVQWLDLLELG